MAEQSKGKKIGTWVACGLLALAFFAAGGMKLAGSQMHVAAFAKWGYPDWFRLVTGAIEFSCAIAILVPKTSFYAAAALVMTMLGAILTHLTHDEASAVVAPVVLLSLAAYVASVKRPVRAAPAVTAPAT